MKTTAHARILSGWVLLLACFGMFASTAFAQTGPVAYWKLDDASGTTPQDSSGNANHCTMSPAATWTTGRVNGALSFDGVDDIVSCGSGSTISNLSAMSVSLWVNLASTGEGGIGRLLQKGDGSDPTAGWRLVTQGTKRIEFTIDHATADVDRETADNAFTVGTWAHIVATWDGTTNGTGLHIYVNGAEVSSYASTGNGSGAHTSDSAATLRIGNRDGGSRTANGKIDEVRLYNRVLSATEIQVLADSTAPSSPTLAATVISTSQVNLSWTAATDNVAVTGYRVERCAGATCNNFAAIATPAGTSFNDTGLSAGTLYRYRVGALDANTNVGYSSTVDATTTAGGGGSGLVAWWKFDEGSGTTPQDSSGNGNHCTMSPPATWTTGQFSGALSFDGVDDIVSCGSGSTIANLSAMSVSAWVNLTSTGEGGLGRIFQKGDGADPSAGFRLVTSGTRRLEFAVDHATQDLDRISADSAFSFGQWSHILVTWDGTTSGTGAHIYVNGAEVSYSSTDSATGAHTSDSTAVMRIGNRDGGSRTANGKIDDVRIYNRVVTASEIQVLADGTPPVMSAGLTVTTVSSTQLDISWSASTDNVAVTGYQLERCLTSSCSFAQIATPSGTSFSDTGRTASTTYSYRVRAVDASGNSSAYSSTVNGTTSASGGGGPTTPGTPSGSAASTSQVNLTWTASTGATSYYVERCTGVSCMGFVRVATVASNSYADTGLTGGTTYRYRIQARDGAGITSAYSSPGNVTTIAGAGTAGSTTMQYDSFGRLKQITVTPQ